MRVKSHIPYMMNLVACLATKNFGKYRDVQGLDVCRKQKNPKQKHLNDLLERKEHFSKVKQSTLHTSEEDLLEFRN